VVVIVFALMLILPSKYSKFLGVSAAFQNVVQLVMSSIVIGVGIYLLYKSQLAVQYCRYSFKALDNPNIVNEALGSETSRLWAEVCLPEDSFGEIEKLITPREEDYLT